MPASLSAQLLSRVNQLFGKSKSIATRPNGSDGFTLIELIIVMAIVGIIFSVAIVNLTPLIPRANLKSGTDVLMTDIRNQQLKAMTGDTEGRADQSAYGVHFDNDRYTAFYGETYSSSEPSNSIFELENGQTFSTISLPNNEVIFAKVNGEIIGFDPAQESVVLKNTNSNQSFTFNFNSLGVVTVGN